MRELLRVCCESFACLVQEEGRTSPHHSRPVRLSRILRPSSTPTDPDAVPPRRALLWLAFWVVLLVGLVLYFKYERLIVPLLA